MGQDISPKVEAFLKEIEKLCRKHGLCIAVSEYDAIQIWDLEPNDEPIHSVGIEDKTSRD